jgi:hypothetical protein
MRGASRLIDPRNPNPWVGDPLNSLSYGRNLGPCVLKFDFPLPEDHLTNILSTSYSPRHQCKLGGGSTSISCTSVYRGSKLGRRVVRLPR